MQRTLDLARNTWDQATEIWLDGGVAMIAIAVIALVMFAVGMNILVKLVRTGYLTVPERTWRRWIAEPSERRGRIGKVISHTMDANSLADATANFEAVIQTETVPFERDLRVMKVCVSAAPLVGLLGTVTGMLATFGALSSGSGGQKTMGMIADGISEALITTETGLVIALPGLFFQYLLSRQFERYRAFLTHLETVCVQELQRREGAPGPDRTRRAAAAKVAHTLLERLHANATRSSQASQSGASRPARPNEPSPVLQSIR